jgi:hypothetical protein
VAVEYQFPVPQHFSLYIGNDEENVPRKNLGFHLTN